MTGYTLSETRHPEIASAKSFWFNPMCCRQIYTEQDFQQFGTIYYKKSKLNLSTAYQAQSKPFVFYRYQQPDVWYGGFILNTEKDFRYFSSFSADKTRQLLEHHSLNEHDLVEICCLWTNVHQVSGLMRIWIYSTLFYKTLQTGKARILAGSFHKKLQKIQLQVVDQPLYEELTIIGDHQRLHQIYYTTRLRFLLNSCKIVGKALYSFLLKSLSDMAGNTRILKP